MPERFLDVSHEALIRGWPRLRRWLDEDRAGLRIQRRITETAEEWQRSNRDDDLLYRGARLIQAQEWRAGHEVELNPLEREFLDASIVLKQRLEQREREQQQRELEAAQKLAEAERKRVEEQIKGRRRQRHLIYGAVTFGFVAAIAVAIISAFAAEKARLQEAKAKVATKRTSEVASRGNVSVAGYLEESGKNAQALAHLAQALRLNPENRNASGFAAALLTELSWHVPLTGSMRHDALVNSALFSPDGRRVVTASNDKTARLWDAKSGKPIGEPMKHQGRVTWAQFSRDSQRVVTVSGDSTARVWDAASGKAIGEPMKHEDKVTSAQFSPDGQRIVTASSADRTARLWDAANGKAIGAPMKHEDKVTSAQFSPDGQRVVTVSLDNRARLWDAANSEPIGEPMRHDGKVNSAQFSPDGQRVVTASDDHMARLWDAASSKAIGEAMKQEGVVKVDESALYMVKPVPAQFSPDGQRVVIASHGMVTGPGASPWKTVATEGDQAARLWDAASGKPLGEPMKHEGEISSAQFSRDGQRVLTASGDKTARLWDANSGKPIGEPMKHQGRVTSAQFSPDSQRVLTVSGDNTVRLWDAVNDKPIGDPMKHHETVTSAQFSPDGQRVLTASDDGMARLWDAASGKAIGEPMKHYGLVSSAQFSPDGQRVLTASDNGMARLWDAASGQAISGPMRHQILLTSAQFSPDGQRVLTVSLNDTAQLWDAATMTDKDTREDIFLLAELAEATAGVAFETVGQTENLNVLTPEQIRASREKIAAKFLRPSSKMTPLQSFMKWSVSDRTSRTISPFSQVTVSEWLENRIKEGTVERLRAALQVDPANARVMAHLGRRLADLALKQGAHPDEVRRSRGEADFLTSRAVKLDPDSDEVKKLRDEVVKLLRLR